MSKRKKEERQSLSDAWEAAKSNMSQTFSFNTGSDAYNSSTANLYINTTGTNSGYSIQQGSSWTSNIQYVLPPVEVKPKTHAEWLKLRIEEMCQEGREALKAA